MCPGYKWLKGKEMSVPQSYKMVQIPCLERDSVGEQKEITPTKGQILACEGDQPSQRFPSRL
jgi:hypothetical protein